VAPPDLDQVERMCAMLTSCDGVPIPPALVPGDFAACVKKMRDDLASPGAIAFSLTLRECGLRSTSCADLRTCALRGASAGACAGRGKQGLVGLCDADGRALTCWHEQVFSVRDCPRGGEQCLVMGGEATCTIGSSCSDLEGADPPRCSASGSHVLRCDHGKMASVDCEAFGLVCVIGPDGAAGCATEGARCSAGTVRCEGNVAVGCVNGRQVRVDCAAGGLSCGPAAGASAVGACAAAPPRGGASGCDPAAAATCEGTRIAYCAAGTPRAYSCSALGLGRCDKSRGGARCAP
jgi:hypothetical protein